METTRSTGIRLVRGGALVLAAAVAVAGWRAVYGRRWVELEEGFRRPVAVLAIVIVAVALLVAVRAARRRSGALALGVPALVVSALAAVDVVQRAVNHGAPVVDVALPLVAVVASSAMVAGALLGRRHHVPAHAPQQLDDVGGRLLR